MLPIIPHFANEALSEINNGNALHWPNYDEKYLIEKIVPLVVQINGKKRGLINIERNLSEEALFNKVKEDKNLKKYLINKSIKKKFFVPNKLINIIIDDV